MKSPLKTLKPQLLEMVAAGLERAAAPFAPDVLKSKLFEMAKLGVAEFRISPLLALDVRKSSIAGAAERFLNKEKIEFHWAGVAALPEGGNNPGGLSGEFYDLVLHIKA